MKLWKKVSIVSLPIVIAGLIIDLLIYKNKIPFFPTIDAYSQETFAALCTIAALGSGILSVIIGSLNEHKSYGYSLKDVLKMTSEQFNIKFLIAFPLILIVPAMLFMSLNFCTAITLLTIIVIATIIYSSYIVWKLVSDDEYVKRIIIKHVVEKPEDKEKNTDICLRIIGELDALFKNGNEKLQDDYIDLLNRVIISDTKKDILNTHTVEKQLGKIFRSACDNLGFVSAYKKIVCLNDWNNDSLFYSDEIVSDFVNSIRFCPANQIYEYNISSTVNDMIENMKTAENSIVRYALKYFNSVFMNSIIDNTTKKEILKEIISNLTLLREGKEGEIRGKILLYICKYCVFENTNESTRKSVFLLIVNMLHENNLYNKDVCYISVVSQIFRALYFYSEYETSTLSEKYRQSLYELFSYKNDDNCSYSVTIANLVYRNPDEIIYWLCEDAISFGDKLSMFDYFPYTLSCKNIIWTNRNLLAFAFKLYLILGYKLVGRFPAEVALLSDKYDKKTKIMICETIVNLFEFDGEITLNHNISEEVQKLNNILNKHYLLPDHFIKQNFEFFNEQLAKLRVSDSKNATKEDSKVCIDDLEELINISLEKESVFKLNKSISLKKALVVTTKPFLRSKSSYNNKTAAIYKVEEIHLIMNEYISSRLRTVKIDFGINGTETLLKELSESKYMYRNYEYINDFAIKMETRKTNAFSQLSECIKTIPFDGSNTIKANVFLKSSAIEYNYELINYSLIKPTDAECDEFINNHKIADGMYRIDGVIFDYKKAIDYVKKEYCIEKSSFKIAIDISEKSGFKIIFKR